MVRVIEKVTAFVTRQTDRGRQVLLFEHPFAGIQIPAGTVEPSETPEKAVIREVFEETGLTIFSHPVALGIQETELPPDQAIILPPATVYARPDTTSFDWIEIRSAVQVNVQQRRKGFSQISYTEYDQIPKDQYVSMQITGWVPDEFLAQKQVRFFFHLAYDGNSESSWEVFSDHHTFNIFWAAWDDLPSIIPPQDMWLSYLSQFFKNKKSS